MNDFYPISLKLTNKLCIVVGGGTVARRRIEKLLACGALVKVISPSLKVELKELLKVSPTLSWVTSPYLGSKALEKAFLVFAATNKPALNQQIHADATSLGIFTNIASDGELSDFIIPSSFNQGDLQVTVSTSGKVPGLSKALKESLEASLGPEYALLINILEQIRCLAIRDLANKDDNLTALSSITNDYLSILEDIRSGVDSHTIYQRLIHNSSLIN